MGEQFCAPKIGARWYIGRPSACYAADPGSSPGGAGNDYANRSFSRFRFIFGFLGIRRVANNCGKIERIGSFEATQVMDTPWISNVYHVSSTLRVVSNAQR